MPTIEFPTPSADWGKIYGFIFDDFLPIDESFLDAVDTEDEAELDRKINGQFHQPY